MTETKKAIVDLDVLTYAFWDKKDESQIIEKIMRGKPAMITPYILLDHLSKWNYRQLAEKIAGFYSRYSIQIATAQNMLEKMPAGQYSDLLSKLIEKGVKEVDVILVIIASLFRVDCLLAYNRKHLRNKVNGINEVLSKKWI